MGLATAELLAPKGWHLVLAGRTLSKLEAAADEVRQAGGEAEACACDISRREEVFSLARRASELGPVRAVIHAAGLSPHMDDAERIIDGNAMGTVNVNDAFYEVVEPGGCVIDTSSTSAYIIPSVVLPKRAYGLCRSDPEAFRRKMLRRARPFPASARPGVAYSISKSFVIWFARTDAARYGKRGVRVLSVTPGNFETPMGELEEEQASEFLKYNAIKRSGRPEEIAALYEALIDERLGYLTGADIICDGGCVAGGAGR